jgi:DNA modification methylase
MGHVATVALPKLSSRMKKKMMRTKFFGEGYDRDDDHDWILFPRDSEWRRDLFSPKAEQHPAKMQLYIVKSAIEYYAESGWKVLDPFAGTGSTALAATMGCKVTLIEIEDLFMEFLQEVRNKWISEKLVDPLDFTIMQGDCRQVLRQLPEKSFDMIITSPPYSVTAQVGEVTDNGDGTATSKDGTVFTGIVAKRRLEMYKYGSAGADPQNIGRLNVFNFNIAMEKVYERCLRVLKPGGLYVSVTKDAMAAGVRRSLSLDTLRVARSAGFEYFGDWFKWKAPGSMFQNLAKSQGKEVVLDEDIMVFRRPL